MADNITLNNGTGGSTLATDEIGGVHYQRQKLIFGPNGTNSGDVSNANPFPTKIIPSDSPATDAFGRLRVSHPWTVFDSNLAETNGSLIWETSLSGSGTVTWLDDEAASELAVTTTNGDSAIRQTKEYFQYQPGKSQLIMMTGVMGAIKANVRQRIGYFDVNNGLFFEQDGTNLKVVRRTSVSGSPVDNAVNQSSWNLDTLDGTGTSGITLDTSKTQIFIIDFEWLGVGRVRMGVVINGMIYYCHQFLNANSLTSVFMARPSLPCRYEITNTGTAASGTTLKQVCSTVISEGGFNYPGVVRSASNGANTVTVSTSLIPLLSIRLKSANIRAKLRAIRLHLTVTNTQTIHWQLLWNPTLTGASFTSMGSTAISEYDVTASSLTGGDCILSGYCSGDDHMDLTGIYTRLNIAANIAGTSDILTIAAIRASGSNATTGSSLTFEELY